MHENEIDQRHYAATDEDAIGAFVDSLSAADVHETERRWSAEIIRLGRFEQPTPAQEQRWERLREGAQAITNRRHRERYQDVSRVREMLRSGDPTRTRMEGGEGTRPTSPADRAPAGRASVGRGDTVRDRALRQIERAAAAGQASDSTAETLTALVEHGHPGQRGAMAQWAAAAGDPDYASAWLKVYADDQRGHLLWTDAERAAWGAVAEYRAMSLTDSAGGFLVPAHLDPAVIMTNAGVLGSVRQLARVERIASDVWHGVSSAGITASHVAEAAEFGDASPVLAGPEIPVYKYGAFVPVSFEVEGDAYRIAEQVALMLADAAQRLQEQTFVIGSGSGQPTGIVTALTGTGSVVPSATADTFAAGDLSAVKAALPARYQQGARWAMAGAIMDTAAAFTVGNVLRFPGLSELPPHALNRPAVELSNMDGAINAGQDNYVAILGDWSNYVIVDRVGTYVEQIPHLFGPNGRPTGQRGWLMWGRYGADSVNDGAFRMLNVT